jgi:hypothetical protein
MGDIIIEQALKDLAKLRDQENHLLDKIYNIIRLRRGCKKYGPEYSTRKKGSGTE